MSSIRITFAQLLSSIEAYIVDHPSILLEKVEDAQGPYLVLRRQLERASRYVRVEAVDEPEDEWQIAILYAESGPEGPDGRAIGPLSHIIKFIDYWLGEAGPLEGIPRI